MTYEYVKRTYSVDPVIGTRVRHMVTDNYGLIVREDRSQSHYVQVKFDGKKVQLPCHPTELQYLRKVEPV